jgi:hypothetical protein
MTGAHDFGNGVGADEPRCSRHRYEHPASDPAHGHDVITNPYSPSLERTAVASSIVLDW